MLLASQSLHPVLCVLNIAHSSIGMESQSAVAHHRRNLQLRRHETIFRLYQISRASLRYALLGSVRSLPLAL